MPAPTDLLITEYVEGTSNNKAIEFWNGTGQPVDLSQYALVVYFNGATTPSSTLQLSGSLGAGETYVLAHNLASADILARADLTVAGGVLNFNGDDVVVLLHNGAVIDSIGQIGNRGTNSQWGTGDASTQDNTIRLDPTISTGDTNPNDAFDPSPRYIGLPTNTVEGLGAHVGPTNGGGGSTPSVSVAATDAAATEGGDAAFAFTFTRSGGDTTQALTVDITYGGTASAADYTDALGQAAPTTITFAANATTAVLTLAAVDDALAENAETVTVTITDGAAYDVTGGAASATLTSDEIPLTLISAIQGSGATAALNGQTVTIEAVVTGDFQTGDGDDLRNLAGFFVQEEGADSDGDAATSEAIFVQSTSAVSVGDRVRITGTVTELFNKTALNTVSAVSVVDTGALAEVAVTDVTIAPTTDYEAVENMLIRVPGTLVISEQFELDRLGEIRLYAPEGDGAAGAVYESADGRPYQYTQVYEPTTNGAVAAYTAAIAGRSVIYDDGLNGTYQPITNPDGGARNYSSANAPQMGDSIAGLTGVMDYDFSAWRIRSTVNGENTFTDANPREPAPADVGGSLKVASLNVLNFFATLDDGSTTDNGQEPRGAETAAELARQVQKLVTTIITLDADVLGLMELENDFSRSTDALASGNAVSYLVDQLNLALGGDVYSWVDPGTQFVGTDAISVGMIYKNDVVQIATRGTSIDGAEAIAVHTDSVHDRPPLAVTFEEVEAGGQVTVVVNHFKSKGSGTGLNADQGDGQGASNFDRMAQANALLDFVSSAPTGVTDTDVILLGDFNAYYQEDPLDVLRAGGFISQEGATSYSYTFNGQLGSLDHIFFNASLAGQVTGATKWHVNSDEADAIDYNLNLDTDAAAERDFAIFDGASPYRVSDHDPILLGLNLTASNKTLYGNDDANTLTGKNGADRLYGIGGDDVITGGGGRDMLYGGAGADRIDGGAADDQMMGGTGNDTLDGGDGIDVLDYRDKSVSVVLVLNGATDATAFIGGAAEDVVRNIERVSGGSAGDVLSGDAGVNLLLGNAGEDVLRGGDGLDVLDGGADADVADYGDQGATVRVTLNGATAVNVTVGGVRADALRSIEGVVGGSAGDTLYGDALDNALSGRDGADVLRGYAGEDRLDGGEGDDIAQGGEGADTLLGGAGFDKLAGEAGDDRIEGGAGNDSLNGGAGADTFVYSRFDGLDAIRDYDVLDTLAFRADSFGLDANAPAPVQFGAKAIGEGATFVYNEATRTLWFDSDGEGGAAMERLVVFSTPTTLDAGDFVLI